MTSGEGRIIGVILMMNDEAETTGDDGESARRQGTAIIPVDAPDGRGAAETDGDGGANRGEPD